MSQNKYSYLLKHIVMQLTDRVMHTNVMYYLKKIENMSKWSSAEIDNWQNEKLQNLIKHAYNNTEYYSNLMKKLKLNPSDIKTKNNLHKLPILTKNDIINNYNKIVPKNINAFYYKKHSTGGSTGEPMRYLLDYNTWSFTSAYGIYSWEKFGYNYGDPCALLGSSSLFPKNKKSFKHKIQNRLLRKYPFNAMNMSDKILFNYVKEIKRKRIKFIYGYASAIYLLSKFVLDKNIDLSNIKACFSTSEILTDEYRSTIEKALHCKVMDCYGARDGGMSAYEIKPHEYYVSYNSIVELKEYQNNTGEILTTDLLNYAFPFIRYQLGDEIALSKYENHKSNFNGQVITKVFGRIPDVMRLENGNILTGPGFTVLFKDLPVKAYRFKKIGYMQIECEIQKNMGYTKNEESLIIATLKKHSGEDCDIKIKYIDEFELPLSGKRHYFISE